MIVVAEQRCNYGVYCDDTVIRIPWLRSFRRAIVCSRAFFPTRNDGRAGVGTAASLTDASYSRCLRISSMYVPQSCKLQKDVIVVVIRLIKYLSKKYSNTF